MRKLKLLLALLLASTFGAGYAQDAASKRGEVPGEGQARVSLALDSENTYAKQENLLLSTAGARPRTGPIKGRFTSRPIPISLTNPRPFITVSSIWHGQDLQPGNLAFEVRHSTDGRVWSEWGPSKFDGHADDDATRRVGQAVQLAPSARFVQFRAVLGGANPMPVLKRLEVLFYSPGETPAIMPDESGHNHVEDAGRAAATCPKPAVTSRATWGAEPAVGSRSYTTVTHLVVHHEVGSNTSSDWAARVRAIEDLHIRTNGWADVGYNYLIDPNGKIYEGRSGGDNVVGAHFCSGNQNTMAVCMLGTYTSVLPTAAALESLKKILAWKASKEGINPLGTSSHYAAGTIANICGHRDNRDCTACPGNTLYAHLPTLRTNIKSYIDGNCGDPPVPSNDTTPPTTSISAPNSVTAVSDDFTATFTDADNVGVAERYYQVLESANGTEWRANRGNGFFNDNFGGAALSPEWTIQTGTWALTPEGHLKQSSTTLTNTNISTVLTQGSGQSYLYQFAAKLNSTTGSRRFGLHIFSDNVAATERNNSYLVWFSTDDQKVRIIETTANALAQRAESPLPITAGTWGDYKATYNSSTGVLNVYVNNVLKLTWTDSTPLTSGSGISLRTNEAEVEWDDVKVYKSRATTKVVTVGPESSNDARKESMSSTAAACKVKSLVRDAAHNWSTVGNLDLVVTFPAATAVRSDGFRARVYPNPVGSKDVTLQYNLEKAAPVTVEIYDSYGNRLQQIANNEAAGTHELPVPAALLKRQGFYFVRISTGSQQQTIRVEKE
jgi:hypothetical protein